MKEHKRLFEDRSFDQAREKAKEADIVAGLRMVSERFNEVSEIHRLRPMLHTMRVLSEIAIHTTEPAVALAVAKGFEEMVRDENGPVEQEFENHVRAEEALSLLAVILCERSGDEAIEARIRPIIQEVSSGHVRAELQDLAVSLS